MNVAVVGGGRWGRITARVLARDCLADRILLVTARFSQDCVQWLARQDEAVRARVAVVGEPPEPIAAAIVATRPSTHARLARDYLCQGVHVLVEKPLDLEREQASALVELASDRGLALGVNHEFLLAAWAHETAELLARGPQADSVELVWHEPRAAIRHGEPRRTDLTVSTALDLFPHVLCLLTVLFGERELVIRTVRARPLEWGFETELSWGGVVVRCDIRRDATGPQRRTLEISRGAHPPLRVDWRTEPARLLSATGDVETLLGAGRPGALSASLAAFLDRVRDPRQAFPLELSAAHHLLEGTRAMENAVSGAYSTVVAQVRGPRDRAPARAALLTSIAEPLERHGLIDHATDADAVEAWAGRLLDLAVQMGEQPFEPLEDLRRAQPELDRDSLRRALLVLREVEVLRSVIVDGPWSKLWRRTLLPLERAGVFDAVLERRAAHPYRLGLYVGVTCMFRCAFCARVDGSRYAAAQLSEGNARFRRVIDDVPTENPEAVFISGGLEPLTNPGLGELIEHAASRGLFVTCYTNGFALTPSTLDRQPGLWSLGTLRFSLYGVDEAEYVGVTSRSGAFERVRANVVQLLAARARGGAGVRIGFNYVVLPGRVERVTRVIEFIARVNEAAGTAADRPIDFVSFREDFSERPEGRLAAAERQEMREAMAAAESRARALCPGLEIDWGYAFHGAGLGSRIELPRISPPEMADATYPQAAAVVDLAGDVYLYQEAGFPGLAGADRYVIGNVGRDGSVAEVVRRFVEGGRRLIPAPGDQRFLDAFDRVMTARVRKLRADVEAGWGALRGGLR